MVRAAYWSAWITVLGLLGVGLLLTMMVPLPAEPAAASMLQQRTPRVQVGQWKLTTVNDWQQGLTSGLLISNNNNGELRLDADSAEGSFISDPISATFAFNAAGAFWRAELPEGTDMTLELRGRATPPPPGDIASDAGWEAWRPLIAGDARSQAADGAFATPDVLEFPPGTRYLQLRVNLSSSVPNASPVLGEITVVYLNTTQGPPTSPGLPRVPISAGPDTLTPPPAFVQRQTWSARQPSFRPNRIQPRGIILHQIAVTDDMTDTLTLLRALTTYQSRVLGWDDLIYHYFIDQDGTLYEGRAGGPTSAVSRLSGGDTAVHVALIGDTAEPPNEAQQRTLTHLLSWAGQAYDIPPTGQHEVLVNNNRIERENIAAHSQVAPEAPDPGEPLRELLPALRSRADDFTIRARWYFTEGNVQDYTQQLYLYNPAADATDALLTLQVENGSQTITRTIPVTGEGRASLTINDIVSPTTDLVWTVEASEPVIAEQLIGLPSDIDSGPGVSEPSRVWYFAGGSTSNSFQTFLLMYNPQSTDTDLTITYMRSNGSIADQKARLPARQRIGINVGDVLPGSEFGIQVVASQPIVVERTMRFGASRSGLHSSPGIRELSRTWFFAEGTTQAPFEMRLLLLNPNRQSAIASVTYMTPDGTEATRRYAVPATTRLSIDVNEFVPELGIATVVEADRPLAAERALYIRDEDAEPLDEGGDGVVALPAVIPPIVGAINAGATEPAFSWRFAGGRSAGTNQYLLISNPGRSQARVTVEFVLAEDNRPTRSIVMPAGSRYTLPIHEQYPEQAGAAVVVRSTQPIVAERSIFPIEGVGAGGVTTLLGVPGT